MLAVFARDTADGQVKCFLVPTDAARRRAVQDRAQDLAADDAERRHRAGRTSACPESARLENVNSFADVAAMLRNMRSDVAWIATGAAAGAYEAALRYVTERKQFGKPLAGFQLIQEKLAPMLANVTASLGMAVRLTQQQDEGSTRTRTPPWPRCCTARMLRETVALAREVSAATASRWTPTSPASMPTPRPSIPTRARTRSTR